MLNHTLEENRKLKELIIMYEKTTSESKLQHPKKQKLLKGKKGK